MENCSSFVASLGSIFDDDKGTFKYAFSAATDVDDLLQSFLNFLDRDDDTSPYPLDFQALATAQNQDDTLLQELQADPQHYARVLMDHNVQLICYMPQANAP